MSERQLFCVRARQRRVMRPLRCWLPVEDECCVGSDQVFDDATWRDAGKLGAWRCSIWQVDNEAATFLARRGHQKPPASLAVGALLY